MPLTPFFPSPCLSRRFETSGKLHQLKIGTYDKLVQLSDDLEKVSSTVESTTARLHKQLLDSKCVCRPSTPQPCLSLPTNAHPTLAYRGWCAGGGLLGAFAKRKLVPQYGALTSRTLCTG